MCVRQSSASFRMLDKSSALRNASLLRVVACTRSQANVPANVCGREQKLSLTKRSLLLLRAWVQSPVGQRARRTSARTQRSISSSSRGSSSRSSAGACSGCWKQSNTQTHTHSTHTRIPTHTYTASKQNFLFLLFRFQKKKKMKWKRNERKLFQLFCCSSFMCVNEEEQKKGRRGRTLANIDNN